MSRVGVLLTNYESAAHLPTAVESVLNQSFTDFTLYLTDNHSPSGEPQRIFQDYASKDERIVAPEIPKGLAGIQFVDYGWFSVGVEEHEYFITLGGHDLWNNTAHLETLVKRMDAIPSAALVYGPTLQINEENKVVGVWPGGFNTHGIAPLMRPQVTVASVDSPQLFGLWRMSLRPVIRHHCCGWDHLIVTEASTRGEIMWEPNTQLCMRTQGRSGENGMESYGRVHLSKENLERGQQDFVDQLEWLCHCVDLICEGQSPDARAANENMLKAAIVQNYFVLRSYNLGAVPDAHRQFISNPLVQELVKGSHHAARMLAQLIKTSKPQPPEEVRGGIVLNRSQS
jgi:hypothetical protein